MKCFVILIAILVIRPTVDGANINSVLTALVNDFKNKVPHLFITTEEVAIKNAFKEAGKKGYAELPSTSVFTLKSDVERRKKHLENAIAAGCVRYNDGIKCKKDGKIFAHITDAYVCCPKFNSSTEYINFDDGIRSCTMTSGGCLNGTCVLMDYQGNANVHYSFNTESHLCYCCKDRCEKSSDCEKNYGKNAECKNKACHNIDRKYTRVDPNIAKKCPTDGDKVIFKNGNYYCCNEQMSDEDMMATRGVLFKTNERFCIQTLADCAPEACNQINSLYDLNTYMVKYDNSSCYCCNDFCTDNDQCEEKNYGKEPACGQSQCIFGNKPICKDTKRNGIEECVSKNNGSFGLLENESKCCTGANDIQFMALQPSLLVTPTKQCTIETSDLGCSVFRYLLEYTPDEKYCCMDYCKKDSDCKENYKGRNMKCSSNVCIPRGSAICYNHDRKFEPCLNRGHMIFIRKASAGGHPYVCCEAQDPELAILEIGPDKIEEFSKKIDGKVRKYSLCDRCGGNLENYKF